MDLKALENIQQICEQNSCKLIAVSKTKPIDLINTIYKTGQKAFGENRAQELVDKHKALAKDIEWHAIGHLQRNKVKYIAPFVHLIHAVDSFSLLAEINKQAEKNNRVIPYLLQFHIAEESSKFGFDINDLTLIEKHFTNNDYIHTTCAGVMGMATFTDNELQIRREFKTLKTAFEEMKTSIFKESSFKEISMGMSGDYKIAIEEGSTMVRVGSAIFGSR